jgi:hypothetical protein
VSLQIPKDALRKVDLGQSFAEYDLVRKEADVFVATPASLAAVNPQSSKRIFIGRRGCGKTAIAYHLARNRKSVRIEPMVFDLIHLPLDEEDFLDTRKQPFRSLVCAFERALLGEVVRNWIERGIWKFQHTAPEALRKERGLIEDCDFDTRVLNLHSEIREAHKTPNPKIWLRQIKRADELRQEVDALRSGPAFDLLILIDRLDEAWDGSESAVICLMALMHACVRLSASSECVRPYLFVRENIFQRIRKIDNEFSRIETSCIAIDWTAEKLIEMIERRLVRNLPSKPKIGEAWEYFFEDTEVDSKAFIVEICQKRPRDVLTYTSFALEMAVSKGHPKITSQDILDVKEKFSFSKLKDLADEFDENYPHIQLILQLFFGLSNKYTLKAIENFIQRLLADTQIAEHCKDWFFDNSNPARFIDLFYQIGFFGIGDTRGTKYKSAGADAASRPSITQTSIIYIHPAYESALHLQDLVLPDISDETILKSSGILEELPAGISFDTYQTKLTQLQSDLKTLPLGKPGAVQFEEVVGEIIKLCFFRWLVNVQPKSRDLDSTKIRDWMASNRAESGFWNMVRQKYQATQIIWECKNYADLSASDFHQTNYYLTGGHSFVIIAFRGSSDKKSYVGHVRNITRKDGGMVLLLGEKDLLVFLRQAIRGAAKDDHLSEIHDRMERSLS